MQDDLTTVKDDMTAFIAGHGMSRFRGYVGDEVQSVMWDPGDNPEAWKDYVELAKAAGAPFVTMSDTVLDKEDVEMLIERLRDAPYPSEEDVDEARFLRSYIGKTGFVQLGFPFQGTIFLYESSTDWYDRYQRLVDVAEEFGGMVIDGTEGDDKPF